MRRWVSRVIWLSIPIALVLWALNRLTAVGEHLTGAIFAAALIALIPLAGRIGAYTDVLETYLGDRLGGLLSAAFDNIPELTIGGALLLQARVRVADPAVRGDALDIVHSMLLGSVINNLLFTLGVAILPAALYYGQIRFSTSSAEYFIAALGLAAVGLGLPTVAILLAGASGGQMPFRLSVPFSLILLISYVAYLAFAVFGLGDRPADVAPSPALTGGSTFTSASSAAVYQDRQEHQERQEEEQRQRERRQKEIAEAEREARDREARAALRRAHPRVVPAALLALGIASLATAAMAAVLVSVTEQVIRDTPLTPLSVGFMVFPIVNNLGEQAGAVTEALQGRVQEALTIAAGSAVQVAFFVTPLLVLASFPLGGFNPVLVLTLLFQPVQLILLMLSVFIFAAITIEGRVHWLHGLQLLVFYLLIAVVVFALPGR